MWYSIGLRNIETGETYQSPVESQGPEEAVELFAEVIGLFEFETIYIREIPTPSRLSSGIRPWRHSSTR